MLDTRVASMDSACDLCVMIDRQLSLMEHVTVVCHSSFNQLHQLRPVVRSLSDMPPRCWSRHSSRVVWTIATHCCTALMTSYFAACSQRRMLPCAVVGTTSHQCYGSCTGCQFVSKSFSRLWGWCTSLLLEQHPHTLR